MVASTSIDPKVVELISQSFEQPLTDKQVTPRIVFITTLATALVGVVCADDEVTEQEKQRLNKTLKQFIPEGSSIGQLTRQLVQGIRKQKLYLQGSFVSKLTETLSESEKLLILCFSYEIAKADGEIASQEQQYIQTFSKILKLEPTHLETIQKLWSESGFESDSEVLEELHSLLDPHRFQSIDPVFAQAASYICNKFPKPLKKQNVHSASISYSGLQKFRQDCKELDQLCLELFAWLEECHSHFALPKTLDRELAKLSRFLQSQKFRLAVVGEFSQGKSTLLNALLGEEIQPVRTIPCSGVVTVLRYGDSLRVICKYKNGREEQIPYESYQEQASIPEDSALCNLSSELAKSEVKEIILEHPGLSLCRHGVEIVDSPGLNEHPDRTSITQQLLQKTDAAIFLANASRPLTQGERELLTDLKRQLNHGQADQPATNLFVLVNFMDLIRREKDKQQVRQLVRNFVCGSTPIVSQDNRLHFISAQAALDALLEDTSDEYLDSLQQFTSALEHFLTYERGAIAVKRFANTFHDLIQESKLVLKQSEKVLDGQVDLSQSKRKQVVNQIGEASGREIRIRNKTNELYDHLIEKLDESWGDWLEGLVDRIVSKSENWTSSKEEKGKILKDYADQFVKDIGLDIDQWLDTEAKQSLIYPSLEILENYIFSELMLIKKNLENLDSRIGSDLCSQFDLSLSSLGIDLSFTNKLNITLVEDKIADEEIGGLAGIALAAVGFAFLPVFMVADAAGTVFGWIFGESEEEAHRKMKYEVCKKGFDTFVESSDNISSKIVETVHLEFERRFNVASEAIKSSIEILDSLLEQCEKFHEESLVKKDIEIAFIKKQQERLAEIEEKANALSNKHSL